MLASLKVPTLFFTFFKIEFHRLFITRCSAKCKHADLRPALVCSARSALVVNLWIFSVLHISSVLCFFFFEWNESGQKVVSLLARSERVELFGINQPLKPWESERSHCWSAFVSVYACICYMFTAWEVSITQVHFSPSRGHISSDCAVNELELCRIACVTGGTENVLRIINTRCCVVCWPICFHCNGDVFGQQRQTNKCACESGRRCWGGKNETLTRWTTVYGGVYKWLCKSQHAVEAGRVPASPNRPITGLTAHTWATLASGRLARRKRRWIFLDLKQNFQENSLPITMHAVLCNSLLWQEKGPLNAFGMSWSPFSNPELII